MESILHLPPMFPGLFFLSFFVPLILRVFLAGMFLLDARKYWNKRDRWWLADGVALVIGVCLFLGYAVQLNAIFGIGYLAFVYYKKDRDSVFLNKHLSFLALAILISLLITGAGALALDLPY